MFFTSAGMATFWRLVEAMQRTIWSLRAWIEGFVGRRAEAKALLRQSLVAMVDEVWVVDQLVVMRSRNTTRMELWECRRQFKGHSQCLGLDCWIGTKLQLLPWIGFLSYLGIR